MISGVNNIEQTTFQPQFSQPQTSSKDSLEPMNSFADEDQAIISAQAKMLNELDKFNAGGDNLVELATASIIAKTTTEAEVNVINAKKHMMDDILDIGK